MADRRSLRLDLAIFVLFFAGLLVAISVFSYDPADPPSTAVYPPHASAKNLLGPPGAWLAATLHDTFGVGVYVFLGSWFVLILALYLRRSTLTWLLRLAGW